ncbi:MAG: heme-binding protein [Planctomycetota bacterium]
MLSMTQKLAVKIMFFSLVFMSASQKTARAAQIDLNSPIPNDTPALSVSDVNTIIAQGVGYLKSVGAPGIISVTDREGHILAIFRMTTMVSVDPRINEQATAKARTAAYFESTGDAFTTRTAQFIVQKNFPPGVNNVDSGPLFGVPFTNAPGTDVQLQVPPFIAYINGLNAPGMAAAPVGTSNFRPALQPLVITPLTDDPGGMPLFKGKNPVGAVGVEIDGFGVLAEGVPDAGVKRPDTGIVPGTSKQLVEETAALACITGFEPPNLVKANKILANGFRFPYVNARRPKFTAVPVATLLAEGNFEPFFDTTGVERDPNGTSFPANVNPVPAYPAVTLATTTAVTVLPAMQPRATPTQEFPRRGWVGRFPPRNSPLGAITKADVITMVQQAADQANLTRAAIRKPNGVAAAVWITVVDLNGDICGLYRTEDATVFSFDLCVQKARTAAFFSTNDVGFSSRAIGFMAQTTYPSGVDAHPPGPLSGLLEKVGGDVTNLGLSPTGSTADNLSEISQLLTDKNNDLLTPVLLATPSTAVQKAVQLLSRRIPHIRDGRLSPLQVSIFVDISLRQAYGVGNGNNVPPTLKNGICIFPGGVPIYKNGVLVGGLGISGDGVDQDDVIAFNGQRGYLPPNNVRCDTVSAAAVKTALLAAIPKLKAEFPNLTNGVQPGAATSPAVIDVVEARLNNGPILEGLRLPYIKIPRASNR